MLGQKKQAAMNEILRLKTEAAMKTGSGRMASRGILSISNLSLPLKKDFVTLLSKGGGKFVSNLAFFGYRGLTSGNCEFQTIFFITLWF